MGSPTPILGCRAQAEGAESKEASMHLCSHGGRVAQSLSPLLPRPQSVLVAKDECRYSQVQPMTKLLLIFKNVIRVCVWRMGAFWMMSLLCLKVHECS